MTSLLASVGLIGTATAQAKSFLEYLKPTPITCESLSSETWGVDGVLPRDLCNGIESAPGKAVPPEYFYWDGQIIRAADGKYHMFMSTWSGSAGFNPGWTGSDAFHAISERGVLGPYMRQDYVYDDNGSHKGHNVSALELLDGTYAVVVSETVPFNIYQSASLDGPWTRCTAEIQTAPGVNGGSDTRWASNVSLVARHDGRYQIVQRHGLIAIADEICGPYVMQKPTWTYPSENTPGIDSIYPRRTSIPGVPNPTYDWEEDPHIWLSGGTYHVLYSGSGDRVGYHLYSPDGINDWTDNGLAFSPREYEKIFGYEGSSTYTQWYKMERPGVVLEDGHPTHITWAVADVNKDNEIPAGSNHGSKVIVVPIDGVAFDTDFGVGMGGSGGDTGAGGDTGIGGESSQGGTTGAGGGTSTGGGETGQGGAVAVGGSTSAGGGGVSTAGGAPGQGGNLAAGGSTSAGGGGASTAGGAPGQGGSLATGGKSSGGGAGAGGTSTVVTASGGRNSGGGSGGGLVSSGGASAGRSGVTSSGGAASAGGAIASNVGGSSTIDTSSAGNGAEIVSADSRGDSNGCGCRLSASPRNTHVLGGLLLGSLGLLMARRRRSR